MRSDRRAAPSRKPQYPAISTLVNGIGKTLKPRVRCVINIKNRGAGIPDGGLFSSDQLQRRSAEELMEGTIPSRGVIEIKPTSEDAWVISDGQQVSRYWGKYRQVLVTNYRDFVIVGQDAEGKPTKLETYRLAPSEMAFWKDAGRPARLPSVLIHH
ncbi:MAG: type ISP restriction/modification enzyme, partial [Bryobacteraceae bacterium]